MKNVNAVLVLALTALGLTACSSTWSGAKHDTARNVERTGSGIEKGWGATKSAVKKGGQTVGQGISKAGEKIEAVSQ